MGDTRPRPPHPTPPRLPGVGLTDLVHRACTVPHRGWNLHRYAAQLVRDLSRDVENGYVTEAQATATIAYSLRARFQRAIPESSGLGWFWLGVIESGLGWVDWESLASRLWADAHPPPPDDTPHAAIAAADQLEEGG